MLQLKTQANKNKRNFTIKVYEYGKIKETIQTKMYEQKMFDELTEYNEEYWKAFYKEQGKKESEEREYYIIPNLTRTITKKIKLDMLTEEDRKELKTKNLNNKKVKNEMPKTEDNNGTTATT